MTQEDKKRLVGGLMLTRQQATEHLGCVRAKARQLAEALETVFRELRAAADGNSCNDINASEQPSWEEVAFLLRDYHSTNGQIAQCETDLKRIGLDL